MAQSTEEGIGPKFFTLGQIADELGVSKSYTSRRARKGKGVRGVPVHEYARFENGKIFGFSVPREEVNEDGELKGAHNTGQASRGRSRLKGSSATSTGRSRVELGGSREEDKGATETANEDEPSNESVGSEEASRSDALERTCDGMLPSSRKGSSGDDQGSEADGRWKAFAILGATIVGSYLLQSNTSLSGLSTTSPGQTRKE